MKYVRETPNLVIETTRKPCAIAVVPCDKLAKATGVCTGHYQQVHSGREIKPVRKRVTTAKIYDGARECTKCGELKVNDDFYKRVNGKPLAECKKCQLKRVRKVD